MLRLLWVPILALGGGLFYGTADEPLVPAKDTGTVLLLQEYRTWEGDIVRKGNKYIVNQNGRPIITLPKEEVIRLCRDWDDVYVFMKSQINLSDPDERKKLAEFFLVNRVPELAMIEIKEALKIRPEYLEAKRLKGIIQKEIDNPSPRPGTPSGTNNSPLEEQLDITQRSRTDFMNRALPVMLERCYSRS